MQGRFTAGPPDRGSRPRDADREQMNDDLLARAHTGHASENELTEVLAWRRRSAENERRYRTVGRLLGLASRADRDRGPGRPPTAAEIIAAAEEVPKAGAGGPRIVRPSRAGRTWGVASLTAAAMILLFLAASHLMRVTPAAPPAGAVQQFVTGPTDQATVVLADGTVVRLAPESRLLIPAASGPRDVTLVGRAYFAVTHDEFRPFTVRTGSGEVRVLGTRFALDASVEDMRLVVVQGRVAVAGINDDEEVLVTHNQMARVIRGSLLPVVEVPDPAILADWVGIFLAFQDTPLRDAAREIEREYGVTIEISDPELADRTITAWFADWTLPEVMEVVCMVANARCEARESVITITPTVPSDPTGD
jgi:transmembrane sensor